MSNPELVVSLFFNLPQRYHSFWSHKLVQSCFKKYMCFQEAEHFSLSNLNYKTNEMRF